MQNLGDPVVYVFMCFCVVSVSEKASCNKSMEVYQIRLSVCQKVVLKNVGRNHMGFGVASCFGCVILNVPGFNKSSGCRHARLTNLVILKKFPSSIYKFPPPENYNIDEGRTSLCWTF